MSTDTDDRRVAFEGRFDLYFPRVYAYLLRRTSDEVTAERLTRAVFVRALPDLLGVDEPGLAETLLRAAHECLRCEATASGEETSHGSESLPPTSVARPSTSLTRASSSPLVSQARRASGASST